MKRKIINIGKQSKIAFSNQLSTKKKNKVLIDYCYLLKKNKRLILNHNKMDINIAKSRGGPGECSGGVV